MEPPAFKRHSIAFDWNEKTMHPSLTVEGSKVRVAKSKGAEKTIHGDYILEPGNKYYWEVKLGYGTKFIIGIAPNPVPSFAKPFEKLMKPYEDLDDSQNQNPKESNISIYIPTKLESQIKFDKLNKN